MTTSFGRDCVLLVELVNRWKYYHYFSWLDGFVVSNVPKLRDLIASDNSQALEKMPLGPKSTPLEFEGWVDCKSTPRDASWSANSFNCARSFASSCSINACQCSALVVPSFVSASVEDSVLSGDVDLTGLLLTRSAILDVELSILVLIQFPKQNLRHGFSHERMRH